MRRKQIGVKFPPELVMKLDVWLEDMNRGRRIPLNRSELIVGTLDWAADMRPDWEGRPASAPTPHEHSAAAPAPALRAAEPVAASGTGERFVEPDETAAPAAPAKAGRKRGR